jgi:ABC-type glycerol-3-phosphate transport system substrate-binding protein
MPQRMPLGRRAVLAGGAALAAPMIGRARADTPVQIISHRYPALEFWAERMKTALPGVTVSAQLMPFDKALELETIALSSHADTLDIVYANESTFLNFAKNGWLRPLDDLWAKYRDTFRLDDFPDAVRESVSWNGHVYLIPADLNVMMFFYRADLFAKAGRQPPRSIADYAALAQSFNSPLRAGTISCLRPVDACLNEAHWYMQTIGSGWFDADWRPIFNDDRGVQAIETLRRVTRSAQRGFAAAANDECMIALAQDMATMGLQWATRAGTMDDPKQSRVVGRIDWIAPPDGRARFSTDGYALSAFSRHDPDTLFRIAATATDEANMREGAALTVPPRASVLNDPALQGRIRYYRAAAASLATATAFPQLPEFYAVGEFIARRIIQAVTGEMAVKPALDAAAAETRAYLTARGYRLG